MIEAVIEENLLYHCLKRLNINSYNLRGDRVIEDLQETWFFVTFGAVHVLKLVSLLQSKVMPALLNICLLIALVLLTVPSKTPLFR